MIEKDTIQLFKDEAIQQRAIRHFAGYKHRQIVLLVEEKAGVLLSTAVPDPQLAQSHPFLNTQALESKYENEKLAAILTTVQNFDEFLRRLVGAGYDLLSYDPASHMNILPDGYKLKDSLGMAGVIWSMRGQFASLYHQPVAGSLQYDHAALIVYNEKCFLQLYRTLKCSHLFNELLQKISSIGLKIEHID